jgi:hypothetical protein
MRPPLFFKLSLIGSQIRGGGDEEEDGGGSGVGGGAGGGVVGVVAELGFRIVEEPTATGHRGEVGGGGVIQPMVSDGAARY